MDVRCFLSHSVESQAVVLNVDLDRHSLTSYLYQLYLLAYTFPRPLPGPLVRFGQSKT